MQTPVYVGLAAAEIFGLVTASRYSYIHAPRDMRSVVQVVVQLNRYFGLVLGIAISPAARDPWLVRFGDPTMQPFSVTSCTALGRRPVFVIVIGSIVG